MFDKLPVVETSKLATDDLSIDKAASDKDKEPLVAAPSIVTVSPSRDAPAVVDEMFKIKFDNTRLKLKV